MRKTLQLRYRLDHASLPNRSEVGGKGHSLMRLFQAGFPVPKGFILTVLFFEPWLEQMKAIPLWDAFVRRENLPKVCRDLQKFAGALRLSSVQQRILDEELTRLDRPLVAVRSSSPDEDLRFASFAGGYTSVLGAPSAQIEPALHSVFSSCFSDRIVTYKLERRVDPVLPRLAVVIQTQIDSEVSGAGFSAHPVSGDAELGVLESNWGLGVTVMAGRVSPDHFVVHKHSGKIVERRLGRKERSIYLRTDGGTYEREDQRHHQWSLDNEQLAALTRLLMDAERLYGPVDIEWAISGGQIFLLQARPITVVGAEPEPREGTTTRF